MKYIILTLLLTVAGCTPWARVNGALWGGGSCLLSPIGAAAVGAIATQDISDSTNQDLIDSRARVRATVEKPAGVCKQYPQITK